MELLGARGMEELCDRDGLIDYGCGPREGRLCSASLCGDCSGGSRRAAVA